MKYYLPEWDDRVDPNYNFQTDTYSKGHSADPYVNDTYIWDVYGWEKVPIDGVLVSRTKLEENKSKLKKVFEQGIHDFLHLPSYFKVMGDCGAFGYIAQEKPPFTSEDTLQYYLNCGFNYGVSVDHLIVPSFEEQNEKRWKITIENARELHARWKSRDEYVSKLRIIGVTQGWNVSSYRKATRQLLRIGYDYIAIGGLARAPSGSWLKYGQTKTVCNIVRAVSYEIRKWCEEHKVRIDLHIFGFARPNLLEEVKKMGVTSFDSASAMRSAWLSGKNYFSDEKNYKAIRIPNPERTRKKRRSDNKALSDKAMQSMRDYEKGKLSIEDVLKTVTQYGKTTAIHPSHIAGYREVLAERPWQNCECKICKDIGIEVVIFRGNERNRRRGFHNINTFYKEFRRISPRVLAFTSCTGVKSPEVQLIPAFQRYLPSPVFKVFWNQTWDLPIDVKILSAKFGLIDWSQPIPYYDYKMQDSDVERFVEQLKTKLRRFDRIYFIGLGLYRKTVELVKDQTDFEIEIFPRKELTTRKALDIIEYTKQMPQFREAILSRSGRYRSTSEIPASVQAVIHDFVESN